jgi:hypothetical protein
LPDGEDGVDCAVAGATEAARPRVSSAAALKTLLNAGRAKSSKTPGFFTPGM